MSTEVATREAVAAREAKAREGNLTAMRRIKLAFKLALVLLATLFALYPVAWIISASFNPLNSLVGLSFIPNGATFANYQRLYTDPQTPFMLWIFNSAKIGVICAGIIVSLTALSAFAFSRFNFPGRRGTLLTVMLVQLFPNTLALVALFLMLQQIGNIRGLEWLGLNTHGGLILIYIGGALGFNTWLMKGFFDSIPRELDEAATIDGANRWQVFYQIILPLSRPILAVTGILTFIGVYGEFLIARLMLRDRQEFTLMVGLFLFASDRSQEWGIITAAALVGALPVVIFFFLTQRQIVSGLSSGAVKG
ncbi:MAG TPA: sugar ABC transporter permease [Chloroflexia bacterium]|nr:sugar ABC transporter permease [Chloroflexia bacterium]